MPIRKLAIGDVLDFVNVTNKKRNEIESVIWNERGIQLILKNNGTEISFVPEFHPCTEMFFKREEKYTGSLFDEKQDRIWEGEYKPIQFTKANLLKFLKKYSTYFEDHVEYAIKNMRLTKRRTEDSEMLDLDDNNVRTIIEKEKTTNIPKEFSGTFPLFGNYTVGLNFEASVTKLKDQYGRKKDQNVIKLRVLNAREAIRDVMLDMMTNFPEEIPKYYGKTEIFTRGRRY